MCCLILSIFYPQVEVIGPGVMSTANEGVLERVAERRIKNGWGLAAIDLSDYVLIAPDDCELLGRAGWVLTKDGKFIKALVVDCEADVHNGTMEKHGLLMDTNRAKFNHQVGWLIFIKKGL